MKILLAGGHILYAKMNSCSLTATYNINRPGNWCVINMLPCNWNNKSHTLTWLKKLSLWWFAVIKINVLIMDVPKMHTSMSPNLQLVGLIFQCEEIEWMTVCWCWRTNVTSQKYLPLVISSALSAQGCLRHAANMHDVWFQIVFVCRPVRMEPTTCRHSRDLHCFDS